MRASPAWQALLRDIRAGWGPPGVHSLVTPQQLARATPAMVTAATVATHAQTRPHSALTPGLALPTSHGAALWKEETEGDVLAPGPWGLAQSWLWARGADRTMGLGAELGRGPGGPPGPWGSAQSWLWARGAARTVGLGGSGQSWSWARVGLRAELGMGPGG